jgi:hypothetical protein
MTLSNGQALVGAQSLRWFLSGKQLIALTRHETRRLRTRS